MPSHDDLIAAAQGAFTANMRPAPIVFERGKGCRLWDVTGREYLDLCAGIAVVSVGHSHPTLVSALQDQCAQLMHVSNLFFNDKVIALAKALTDRTMFDRVYFSNSGTEAIEALIKLARRYHHDQGRTERRGFIAAERSFHGRTMGALSLTGQPKYQVGMGPLLEPVSLVPFGDLNALEAAINPSTAAVILEPVQAEGGIFEATPHYLRGVREMCDRHQILLFLDEVQTGYGRTGKFLASEWSGIIPDGCALAKGMGGGFPIGGIAVKEFLKDGLPPGSHATTFGGNALAAAAGLAVLKIFDDESILLHVQKVGAYLGTRLEALRASLPEGVVTEQRGLGLLQGLALHDRVDAQAALARIRDGGVLLSLAGGQVLRFSPPLVVSEAEIDEGLQVVADVLSRTRPAE